MLKNLFLSSPKNAAIQFFRNMIAGIAGTLLDFAVLIFCEEVFLLGEVFSTVIGFVAGLALNYVICRAWVFPESHQKNAVIDFLAFLLIGVIGLFLTQVIISPFSEHGIFGVGYFVSHVSFGRKFLPETRYYIIGKTIAVILVYFWNYFARKKILYGKYRG